MNSEKKEKNEQPKSIEEQIKEMFKKANISFMMGPFPASSNNGKDEIPNESDKKAIEKRIKAIRQFNYKPRDVYNYLNRFVIKQDEAKKVLSVAVCDHYNRIKRCINDPSIQGKEYLKHNILILGPTGVGKTYLLRCIAQFIGVPFVKADATKFSETGYVGRDVEDLVRDLVQAADGNPELAQYGIIFLDEIDKIASRHDMVGRDVSGRGVQINLLKLLEETDVSLFSQTDLIGQVRAIMDLQKGKDSMLRTINTRYILFVASGAFGFLAEKVRARLKTSHIGFAESAETYNDESECLRLATTQDFIDFGFEPEFIGRLPVRVVCDPLSVEDLESIMLKSEGSILQQYKDDFAGYGIDIKFSREAIRAIAEKAASEKTGARGLMTVLERLLRNFKFELPSCDVTTFEVTAEMVRNPTHALEMCMKQTLVTKKSLLLKEINNFAETFYKMHGIQVVFRKEAAEYMVEICMRENKSVADFCTTNFKDLEYAFKMIAANTGQTKFYISRRMVEDPRGELSKLVAASFEKKH